MSFFQNKPNPPGSEKVSGGQSETSSYSAGNKPLFKQEPFLPTGQGAVRHISLSDYVARHFREDPGTLESIGGRTALLPIGPAENESALTPLREAGHLLNRLDVELAAGLEQYLPTPAFRLKVARKRLDGEIAELRARLTQYERLSEPSREIREVEAALRDRLVLLEAHQREVSGELLATLWGGRLIYAFCRWLSRFRSGGRFQPGRIGRWLGRLLYGQAYAEMENDGAQLENLLDLLTQRMHERTPGDGSEIGQLINRYERLMQHAEKAAVHFRVGAYRSLHTPDRGANAPGPRYGMVG